MRLTTHFMSPNARQLDRRNPFRLGRPCFGLPHRQGFRLGTSPDASPLPPASALASPTRPSCSSASPSQGRQPPCAPSTAPSVARRRWKVGMQVPRPEGLCVRSRRRVLGATCSPVATALLHGCSWEASALHHGLHSLSYLRRRAGCTHSFL